MKLKGLYLVTPDHPGDRIINATERAIKSGVDILQYRDKTSSFREKLSTGRKLAALCHDYNIPFIVDDDPVLMDILGADGIHIGKDDVPFDYIKSRYPDRIIGVSTYGNLEDALAYQKLGADYVAFGSFFPTNTKEDATMCDINVLNNIKNIKIPVFVIGGINSDNIDLLLKYRISGIAVVSAIYSHVDIERQVSYFKEKLSQYKID
jgi:thiamine-phosphate pyrophosphorylase